MCTYLVPWMWVGRIAGRGDIVCSVNWVVLYVRLFAHFLEASIGQIEYLLTTWPLSTKIFEFLPTLWILNIFGIRHAGCFQVLLIRRLRRHRVAHWACHSTWQNRGCILDLGILLLLKSNGCLVWFIPQPRTLNASHRKFFISKSTCIALAVCGCWNEATPCPKASSFVWNDTFSFWFDLKRTSNNLPNRRIWITTINFTNRISLLIRRSKVVGSSSHRGPFFKDSLRFLYHCLVDYGIRINKDSILKHS